MNKTGKKRIVITAYILILIILALVIILLPKSKATKMNFPDSNIQDEPTSSELSDCEIFGSWAYEDGTIYEFNNDMTGGLYAGDYKYTYTFSLNGNYISIDYDNEEVHDAKYTFEIVDGRLKLIGGEGTAGGSYLLERK